LAEKAWQKVEEEWWLVEGWALMMKAKNDRMREKRK